MSVSVKSLTDVKSSLEKELVTQEAKLSAMQTASISIHPESSFNVDRKQYEIQRRVEELKNSLAHVNEQLTSQEKKDLLQNDLSTQGISLVGNKTRLIELLQQASPDQIFKLEKL